MMERLGKLNRVVFVATLLVIFLVMVLSCGFVSTHGDSTISECSLMLSTTNIPTRGLLFALFILALIALLLSRLLGTKRDSSSISVLNSPGVAPPTGETVPFFNHLVEAFRKGILNPKLYEPTES